MSPKARNVTSIERGDRESFACKIEFYAEPEPRGAVEPDLARSWGALSIWVNGRNLCRHWAHAQEHDAVHWHLLPLLEWLTENWDPLFHEERTPQTDSDGRGAASSLDAAFPLDASAEDAVAWFSRQQMWIQRHGIQSAAEGGLFPRLFVRRFRGEVEFSWDNRSLLGGPDDLAFGGPTRGYELADLADATSVIHDVLTQAVSLLERASAGSARVMALKQSLAALAQRNRADARVAWLAGLGSALDEIRDRWDGVLAIAKAKATRANAAAIRAAFAVDSDPLAVLGSCRAALLFGSLSPTISETDVDLITRLLITSYAPAHRHRELEEIARHEELQPDDVWQQGYELAEDVHARLAFDTEEPIDVVNTIRRLNIRSMQVPLSDPDVRGLSLASDVHRPTVAWNKAYVGNERPEVLRFTLAHELCHLLFDRYYERELAMASGPWAPPALEQRANAFAAMFLMPRPLVRHALSSTGASPETLNGIRELAEVMRTSITTTIDHLCNLNTIDLSVRDRLREELGFNPR